MNKIIEIYKKLSLPVKASLWYLICNILQRGISVITTPIFTRILSTQEYGVISVYNSWESIVTIFATLNLSAGVFNNAMVKYPDDRNGYTSVMQSFTTGLTVVLIFIYLLGRNFWNTLFDLSTPMIIMMFIDIIFTAGMSFWTVKNRYEFKYKSVCIVTFAATILAPILSVIFVFMTDTYKSEAKVFGVVVAHFFIYGAIYILNLKNGRKVMDKEYISYSVKFNIPLIPHYLSQSVLNQADRLMINSMCSTVSAGIYSVAYSAGSMINIVTNSVNASYVPLLYENLKKGTQKKIGNTAVKIQILIGSLCFLFSLFAPEIVKLLATEDYYEAIWIIPPVSMSSLFIMMYSFFTNVEFYFEKNKFIMIASVMTAGLNVVLNYIFIILFGYIAAGYTTLACYVFYCFAQYLFMKKVCRDNNVDNPYNGRLMWTVAIVFVCLSIVSELLYQTFVLRYAVILVLCIIGLIVAIKYRKELITFIKR